MLHGRSHACSVGGVVLPSGRGHAYPVAWVMCGLWVSTLVHAQPAERPGLSCGAEAAALSPVRGGGRLLAVPLACPRALQAGALSSGSKPGSRDVLGAEVLEWVRPRGLRRQGRASVDGVACPAWGRSSCAPICDPQGSPWQRHPLCSCGELQGRDTPALAQVRTTDV